MSIRKTSLIYIWSLLLLSLVFADSVCESGVEGTCGAGNGEEAQVKYIVLLKAGVDIEETANRCDAVVDMKLPNLGGFIAKLSEEQLECLRPDTDVFERDGPIWAAE
uniref:Inhibitor I9 domain-containing protein n=1 Tax=Rhodosorus marinus TaxID=101924 RepID=A0A7S3EI79_9RHOD|mmetsp:Transcript_38052/g.151097  ORF Transcript_38052/g.151097 Transcript_38052/m.151097 type:complete len:107 (+) Transcript_38052:195-515(+)|eukprot:CAMPEP_0113968520 /NCGR_PEP_ID=MMETSP0011_2-20120614/9593_1 /TAXON_ID=101924 /ORGANISM="Rhodosorus marinus" /LENGTH=106 /DNA_ID=CAMNT_0000981647 /DNA_START=113 /DNA_END=433 /DNA_ORIENTATION=- /assembly_acc=CAM_ASM_000156